MPADSREMQSDTFREAPTAQSLGRLMASWAVAMGLGGLFLGFVGATDSYQYSLLLRLGFWLGLCLVAGVFAVTIESALLQFGMRSRKTLIWWVTLTVSLALAMVPVIFLANSTGSTPPVRDLPLFAMNSFAISGALVGLRLLVGHFLARSNELADASGKSAQNAEAKRPALMQRLRPGLRNAQLHALKSEGHYVRVFTELGSELILMRLKDAILEVGETPGMQVHRSWWIARRPDLEQITRGGRLELRLNPETWVPISRTYTAEWKAAAW